MAFHSDINIENHAMLRGWLRDSGKISRDESPTFATLAGGVSNRTVRVEHEGRSDWVLKQALQKLRVEADWFSSPQRIHREAAGLRWLGKIIPNHVPKFVFEDESHHILAMRAVPQPHENWKQALLAGQIQIEYAQSFGCLLAKIHNAIDDYPMLAAEFADRQFFEELRLAPYYSYTAAQVPAARAMLTQLIADVRQRRLALAHGDYSPKNVLVHQGRLYILDYEVIHFGDPAFDIGFSMTHFLSKAHFMPDHRSAFIDMAGAYWETYQDNLAAKWEESHAVRHTLACLLARVAGRSPLEYLNAVQRRDQQKIVLDLISQDITTIPQLIRAFSEGLALHDA